MKLQALILGNEKNLGRKIYLWTILSGIAYAATTLLLTWVVTMVLGEQKSDSFYFAYTTAQLFLTVGFYGMRVFQASDMKNAYCFQEYCSSRVISCAIMMLASVVFVLINGYDMEKTILIILVCAYRGFDAVSDVFEALYQQNGRMDLSGKSSFFKIAISTIVFILVFLLTKSPVWATLFALISTILVWLCLDIAIVNEFARLQIDLKNKRVRSLLLACLPLCMGNFLCNYIFSASKFAIDQQAVTEGIQTIYNILFMPASVINLFSGFIFKPMVTSLAMRWGDKKYHSFQQTLFRLTLVVGGLTLLAVVAGYFLGTPILGFIYHVDLSSYRWHLSIMIIGGGLSAFSTVLYYVATIMRCQKQIMLIYALTAVLALSISGVLVKYWGLMGAALGYLLLMLFMTMLFVGLWIWQIKKAYQLERKDIH